MILSEKTKLWKLNPVQLLKVIPIPNSTIEALGFKELIQCLKSAFQRPSVAPLRHHHDYSNANSTTDNTLLLMPAWDDTYLGIKTVIVAPGNSRQNLPTINARYALFDKKTGIPLAQMDAKLLTAKRTAAASALASSYLALKNAKKLLMMGTGNMVPHLINAHCVARPIEEVWIWGRKQAKAQKLVDELKIPQPIYVVEDLRKTINEVDIISCATSTETPIVKGEWLRAGQHLDLVGSFKPNMREADDIAIAKSKIYVDTKVGALKESGDLVIPLQRGIIQEKEVKGDLFDLCRGLCEGRNKPETITFFKSVGHALEDLAVARLVYEMSMNSL